MKFLLKILELLQKPSKATQLQAQKMPYATTLLIVVMIGVVAGNVNGMAQVDLPADTPPAPPLPPAPPPMPPVLPAPGPGAPRLSFDSIIANGTMVPRSLRPNVSERQINGAPNVRCVYFAIIPTAGWAVANVAFTRAVVSPTREGDTNIYFPADGHQPTTPEAVAYSCANIDNRENSPITDWYMQMFGVIPFQNVGAPGVNDYIKAGWTNPTVVPPTPFVPAAQRIITFHANVDNTMVNDPDAATGAPQITRQQLFIQNFRKIASTSVGRVLLYRILIEIRRQSTIGNARGCPEIGNYATGNLASRNNLRSIEVNIAHNDFSFSPRKRRIKFSPVLDSATIIGKTNREGYTNIVRSDDTVDISLFHEMIHWYHYLRYTNRYLREPAPHTTPRLENHYLGKYYWSALNCRLIGWTGQVISGEKWENRDNILDFEEMRTVLGVPYLGSIENYAQNYKEGDDLSENLYKMCIGAPLRFGYDNLGFYEDRKVINRVINACIESYIWYTIGYNGDVGFAYGLPHNRKGLGKCQIQ
ncbi:MAG: hypothetical protein LBP41_02105 [Holosporaceae bacterium]|jgi:hypothetical protein|nr:hypothetical protein [Holosporaceae bacterium]